MDLLLRMPQVIALVKAARERALSMLPLGITARLGISLLAVAVLGSAANMIAHESVSIIRISIPPTPAPDPAPAVPAPSFLSMLRQPMDPPNVPRSIAPTRASIDGLRQAADRFERASRLRAETNSDANETEFIAAADALGSSPLGYGIRGFPGTPNSAAVERLAAELRNRGESLIRAADQRRAARLGYSEHLQAMTKRMQPSPDGAWKIFGRVFARQSLMQLRPHLDAIRQHSQSILSGDTVSAGDIDLLTASEKAFAAALEAHRKRLEKNEGPDWVRDMREDFAALLALHGSLYSLSTQLDEEFHSLDRAHAVLSAAIVAAAAPTPLAPLSRPAAPAPPPVRSAPPPPAPVPVPVPATSSEAPAAASENVPPAEPMPPDHNARILMAVTMIVILFITAISIATIRAVLTPVRRILRATERISKGDMQVRVPRGGIRELDTLAGAFNDMAARLAAARAHSRNQQEHLEETVLQRTHKLQQLAQQDPLTSLPNRRHLSTLLSAAIERADRQDRTLGVYFLDIDNFKNFNDSLGHVFGDRVLMSVANRLEELADGLGFVARLGGDEFTFIYEGASSMESIQAKGWALVQAFQKLVSVDDRELSVSVSVGACIFPDHGRDAEVLLRAADSALFRAKELGRSQLALFTPELTQTAARRFSIEQGLRRAIENSEFELAYQPEVSLSDANVGLVEALVRWRMPDGVLAKPGEFLGVAEQSGLITEINNWVLRTAVRDASIWHHGGWPDARVAVNISPRQLLDRRFVELLLALTSEHRLPASCIELELTEKVLQTGPSTIAALRVLQSAGFGIALDDFGTGYSSLTSLEQLPLSRIKLDRSLIAGTDTSSRSAAIARAIIDLCEGLGLPVTAEGIERPEQFAWLLGCRSMYLQGYLLSDAVPFADVLEVNASLPDKIEDLMLSLPVPARRRASRMVLAKGGSGR